MYFGNNFNKLRSEIKFSRFSINMNSSQLFRMTFYIVVFVYTNILMILKMICSYQRKLQITFIII